MPNTEQLALAQALKHQEKNLKRQSEELNFPAGGALLGGLSGEAERAIKYKAYASKMRERGAEPIPMSDWDRAYQDAHRDKYTTYTFPTK